VEGISPLFVTIAYMFGVILLDYSTSESFHKNISVLKQNGYSAFWIYFGIIQSIIYVFIIVFAIVRLLCSDMIQQIYDLSDSSSDPYAAIKFLASTTLIVLGNLFVSDLFFTPIHQTVLHGYFPTSHHMHHCCTFSTISSTFTFELIDLMCEFLPAVFTVVGSHFLLGNKLATFASLVIVVVWYATINHDETIKSSHYYHHRYISSKYYAYAFNWLPAHLINPRHYTNPYETVRPLVVKNLKKLTNSHKTT